MKKTKTPAILILLCLFSLAAAAANPVVFTLKNIKLANGWIVSGTIATDGSTGALGASNIVDWNLKIVQTTDVVWTEKDSNDLNISRVSSDGKSILVATSPDGSLDGGTLYFGRYGGYGIPTNAVIADFTQLSFNLGYGYGGIAGWQDEIWGLNFVGLNKRNNTQYHAAAAVAVKPNVFQIHVPVLANSPLLMTMFGTVTTDGTTGALLPQNIVAWKITARNRDISYMTKADSIVMYAGGVTSDGQYVRVDHASGQLVIGRPGMRPTFVTLADFTDPSYPNGFANYYTGSFGVMGDRFPLLGNKALSYIVAKNP